MKLSAAIIGFWTNIAIFLFVGAAEAYIITWVLSGKLFIRYSEFLPDLEIVDLIQRSQFWIILIICELLTVGGFLRDLRKRLIEGVPDSIQVTKASLEDYPKLDRAKFKSYTESLRLQGFTHVIDYSSREIYSDCTKETPGLSRLLINDETKCYANIFQLLLPSQEPLPVFCTIITNFVNNGTLVNSNFEINSVSLCWNSEPHNPWFSIPTARPEQLYHDHLNFCSLMRTEFNILPQEVSENAYFEIEQKGAKHRKNSIKNANIFFSMIKATWFEVSPYSYWLGGYDKYPGAKAKAQEIVDRYGLS